jgi:hypothetical protein
MQIHELTKRTVPEGIGSALGLNNPVVSQAWGSMGADLLNNLAAKYTKDPRYTQIADIKQRTDVMARDAEVKAIADKLLEKFKDFNYRLLFANNNQLLPDASFAPKMTQWVDANIFRRKLDTAPAGIKTQVVDLVNRATKSRDPGNNEFEKAFRELVALWAVNEVDIIQGYNTARAQTRTTQSAPAQSTITTPPAAGAPTPAEQARLQQMIQQKLGKS